MVNKYDLFFKKIILMNLLMIVHGTIVGCSSSKKTTTNNSADASDLPPLELANQLFVKTDEIKFEVTEKITKEILVNRINSNGAFVNQKVVNDNCGTPLEDALKAKIDGHSIIFRDKVDLLQCTQQIENDNKTGLVVKESFLEFSDIEWCNLDVSQLEGKTVKELLKSNQQSFSCLNVGAKDLYRGIASKVTLDGVIQGKSANNGPVKVETFSSSMAPDNKLCHYQADSGNLWTLVGECLTNLKIMSTDLTGTKIGFISYRQKDTSFLDGDRYFRTGTIEFYLANWHGVMTYTGAEVAPTWTATSDSGEQASGTFGIGSKPSSPLPTTPNNTKK